MTDIKICGITNATDMKAALALPIRFVGLVFVPKSSRYVDVANAAMLSRQVTTGIRVVGLFQNPTKAQIDEVTAHVHLDMIQLHGDETPDFVQETRDRTAIPVMKAIAVRDDSDLRLVQDYDAVSDWLLFDAKTKDGRSGGTGHVFDWSLLQGLNVKSPWMLAGGLNPDNVAQAIEAVQPDAVDVSSGVEGINGEKDACKLREFVEAVHPCQK